MLEDAEDLETICNDIGKYKLQILGIAETHVVGE